MASIEGGGDSGGHKKGPGVKKSQKTFYQGGYDTHGGSGFPFDHFLHFYHNNEYAYNHGPDYA